MADDRRRDWRAGFVSTRRERTFQGDEISYLPRSTFDYKMWFEVLKVAHRSNRHHVRLSCYEGWESPGKSLTDTLDSIKSKKFGSGFKKWFFDEEHWRTLFSSPVQPAELIKTKRDFERNKRSDRVIVAVSAAKTVPAQRAEIEEILIQEARRRGSNRGQAPKSPAQFVIPPNRQIEMTTYMRMLRVYECDLDDIHWTDMHSELSRRYKNPPSELAVDTTDDADRRRVYQMVFRDRTRLASILRNVCAGRFP